MRIMLDKPIKFQSTLLMRGATLQTDSWFGKMIFQSTLLMRGATVYGDLSTEWEVFQSTLLMRGATTSAIVNLTIGDFNPRSSCEERPTQYVLFCPVCLFQSTLLMRGATLSISPTRIPVYISIHAPHARSDLQIWVEALGNRFQSTLLMRGATRKEPNRLLSA